MKTSHLGCIAAALVLVASSTRADDAGVKTDAGALKAGVARDAGVLEAGAPLPTGHPMVTDEEDTDEPDPHAHNHAQGGTNPNQLPRDGVIEDPTLPVGTIQIHVADVDSKPQPRQEVTLGILYNSIAKGESRKRVTALTDDTGTASFKNLDTGTGVAYRAMILKGGATFAVTPFVLTQKMGSRVLVHTYPIESDIEKLPTLGSRTITYVEVKDDRIQVQQFIELVNVGRTAWVPENYVIPLPAEFTAFATQQGMSDVGADAIPKKGVKLRGTFTPGQHSIEFRWQLPYSGDAEVSFDVGLAPHTAIARVMAPASRQMVLEVEGSPPPRSTTDGTGQRVLVTEVQATKETGALTISKIEIKNLPTEGPAKIVATLLAALGLVAGGVVSAKKQTPRNLAAEREKILASLDALERAREGGEVGPKTYERNRRNLLDDLARTYAAEPAPPKKKPEVRRKPADGPKGT